MNRKLSIACLQYASAKNEKHTLETIKDLIDKALNVEAEFITLPECATSLQKNSFLTNKLATTEDENFSLQVLKEIAHEKLKASTSERIGRMIDKDPTSSIEEKKKDGYF